MAAIWRSVVGGMVQSAADKKVETRQNAKDGWVSIYMIVLVNSWKGRLPVRLHP